MEKEIQLSIDWESVSQLADNPNEAIQVIKKNASAMVLEKVSRAFDEITSYEASETIQTIANQIDHIVIAYSSKRGHSYDAKTKTLTIDLRLEFPTKGKPSGLYNEKQLVQIIKFYTLSEKKFCIERIAAAAQLEETAEGDLSLFFRILEKYELWLPTEEEVRAFNYCEQVIKKTFPNEKKIRAWHVIEITSRNRARERILFLTDVAYYNFRYDPSKQKIGKYTKYDLKDIFFIDIGDTVCKVYRLEAKRGLLETLKRKKRKKQKFTHDSMKRNSLPIITATHGQSYLKSHPRKRVGKDRPPREKPDVYNRKYNVFTAFDPARSNDMCFEIAWIIYAAKVSRMRQKCEPPCHGQVILKPSGGVTSIVYNAFGWKVDVESKRSSFDFWVELINPLHQLEGGDYDMYEFSLEKDVSQDWVERLNPLYQYDVRNTSQNKEELYRVEKRIASGSEGSIFLAENIFTGEKVALKAMNYTTSEQKNRIDLEIELVQSLHHENIVRHYDAFLSSSETIVGVEKCMYLVMEMCDTSLENYIANRNKQQIEHTFMLRWIYGVIKSLQYMHSNNIIHRDIKSENILFIQHDPFGRLLEDPKDWIVKLCDFGFSVNIKKHPINFDSSTPAVGTPIYMAPEISLQKPYDYKVDIWSLGVVILQMLLVSKASEMPNVFQKVLKKPDYVKNLCKNQGFNSTLSEIAYRCCKLNPDERPSADLLLKRYFKNESEF